MPNPPNCASSSERLFSNKLEQSVTEIMPALGGTLRQRHNSHGIYPAYRRCKPTTARKRTLAAVKLAHADTPFERGADRCDFTFFDSDTLCATSTAERRQVKGGRTRNVVGTIGADKDKTKTYCQILDLDRQIERAEQEKDRKRTGVLSQKINQLQKQLGPELVTLANILKHVDLKSLDGREIASIIQSLNQSCPE